MTTALCVCVLQYKNGMSSNGKNFMKNVMTMMKWYESN